MLCCVCSATSFYVHYSMVVCVLNDDKTYRECREIILMTDVIHWSCDVHVIHWSCDVHVIHWSCDMHVTSMDELALCRCRRRTVSPGGSRLLVHQAIIGSLCSLKTREVGVVRGWGSQGQRRDTTPLTCWRFSLRMRLSSFSRCSASSIPMSSRSSLLMVAKASMST